MTDVMPEQPLLGYPLRDLTDAITTLRQLRQARRESQRDTARRIGTNHSTLCEWETGLASPAARSLFAWADALGLDVALIPRDQPCGGTGHVYLSTACLHVRLDGDESLHGYCQGVDRVDGLTKTPAQCKWCEAGCVCPCHRPPRMVDVVLPEVIA